MPSTPGQTGSSPAAEIAQCQGVGGGRYCCCCGGRCTSWNDLRGCCCRTKKVSEPREDTPQYFSGKSLKKPSRFFFSSAVFIFSSQKFKFPTPLSKDYFEGFVAVSSSSISKRRQRILTGAHYLRPIVGPTIHVRISNKKGVLATIPPLSLPHNMCVCSSH